MVCKRLVQHDKAVNVAGTTVVRRDVTAVPVQTSGTSTSTNVAWLSQSEAEEWFVDEQPVEGHV